MILQQLNKKDFLNYVNLSKNNYAKEIGKSRNIELSEAIKISNEEFKKTLPDGFKTKNNFFYNINYEGKTVGMIWICTFIENNEKMLFIYDLKIEERFRNQGHAKAAIKILELKAYDLEAKAIGLHVFYHNKIAYSMYQKLGFIETKKGKKSYFKSKKIKY